MGQGNRSHECRKWGLFVIAILLVFFAFFSVAWYHHHDAWFVFPVLTLVVAILLLVGIFAEVSMCMIIAFWLSVAIAIIDVIIIGLWFAIAVPEHNDHHDHDDRHVILVVSIFLVIILVLHALFLWLLYTYITVDMHDTPCGCH